MKRVVLGVIGFFVIYGNVASMLNGMPRDYVPTEFRLPLPRAWRDCFDIFGVFGGYRKHNTDYAFWAMPKDESDRENATWSPIDVLAYLPEDRGRRLTFVWAYRHQYLLGYEGQNAAWQTLADKVRKRYNRDHPDWQAGRMAITELTWPSSPQGLDAARTPDAVEQNTIFREERR